MLVLALSTSAYFADCRSQCLGMHKCPLITRIGFTRLMLVIALSASTYSTCAFFADGRLQFLGMYKWWFWRWVSM